MNSSTDTAGLSPMTLALVAAAIFFMSLGKGGCDRTTTPANWGGLANASTPAAWACPPDCR